MKGKLIAFASFFCIASLMVSGANAGKPDKPGKPPKTNSELIVFTGDLQGSAHVDGCCPNDGPFPEYTLTLTKNLTFDDGSYYPAGDHFGHVFMNNYRVGKDRMYVVQFWTEGDDHICIEVVGGVVDHNKKTKVLTVTFEDLEWSVMHDTDKNPIELVSFVLTRSPI